MPHDHENQGDSFDLIHVDDNFFGNIVKLIIVSRKDIPIFQDEFLKLNKAREMELRSLRKNAIELEEHSALLQNHVDNMESVVADLEQEV